MALRSLHARLKPTVCHSNSVGVDVSIEGVRVLHAIQKLADALGMTHWTIFVTHEQCSKISNLIVKLTNLLIEGLVFCRIHFHFGLEVCQPLLLALSTFQGSDTI